MPTKSNSLLTPHARELDALTRILADESERPATSVFWRDAFCHECGANECIEGTEFSCYRIRPEPDLDVGHFVNATRTCERCGESVSIEVMAYNKMVVTLTEFGQWLSRRHDCNAQQRQHGRATGFIQQSQS